MLVHIFGAKCIGIDAVKVTVEVDITMGIGIHLCGLGDIAVKESLLRTITALQSLNYHIPGKKIVINLAPADLHKSGRRLQKVHPPLFVRARGQRNGRNRRVRYPLSGRCIWHSGRKGRVRLAESEYGGLRFLSRRAAHHLRSGLQRHNWPGRGEKGDGNRGERRAQHHNDRGAGQREKLYGEGIGRNTAADEQGRVLHLQ